MAVNAHIGMREVNKMKIITLCGSTKFKKEFEDANRKLTLQGNMVLSVGLFGHADNIELTTETKEMLDKLHIEKIKCSDEIFVINVGGYIGESTMNEINYAKSIDRVVNYLEVNK
ncbi:MAG: hypothetical protein K0Q53_147 [Massilibacillus sp.]|jgi:hypothetical protein|nr:hypothetical protein [Massilibacillus sp.]